MCMACEPQCEKCHYVTWRPEVDIEYTYLSKMCVDCRDETDGSVPVDEDMNHQNMLAAWEQYTKEYRWRLKEKTLASITPKDY